MIKSHRSWVTERWSRWKESCPFCWFACWFKTTPGGKWKMLELLFCWFLSWKKEKKEGRREREERARKKGEKKISVLYPWPCGLTEMHTLTAGARLAGVMGWTRHPDRSSRWRALMPLLRPSLFQIFAVIEDSKFPWRERADYII